MSTGGDTHFLRKWVSPIAQRVPMTVNVAAIIAAAGSGKRLGFELSKPLVSLDAVPLFVRTLRALTEAYPYTKIVMAVDPGTEERIHRRLEKDGFREVILIRGGRTRAQSVFRAFSLLSREDRPRLRCRGTPRGAVDGAAEDRIVLIHDVARPFVKREDVVKVIRAAHEKGAAILAERVTSTVKECRPPNGRIRRTLDRQHLFLAQTPQAFRYEILEEGYRKFGARAFRFTDEAALVEAVGHPVFIVEGRPRNLKITTPEDLEMARAMIRGGRP